MTRVKDYFFPYLEYCETKETMSPGEYLEKVVGTDTSQDFVRLTNDLIDTFNAGRLIRITLPNGGVCYVRKIRSHLTK